MVVWPAGSLSISVDRQEVSQPKSICQEEVIGAIGRRIKSCMRGFGPKEMLSGLTSAILDVTSRNSYHEHQLKNFEKSLIIR